MSGGELTFHVLGPLEVRRDGRPLPLAGKRQRTLLARLVLDAGHLVPTTALIDTLWPHDPPETARGQIKTTVWRLRRAIEDKSGEIIVSQDRGYLVAVDPGTVDAFRSEAVHERARGLVAAGRPDDAAPLFAEAAAAWYGEPLAGLDSLALAPRIEALSRLRLVQVEDHLRCELARGRYDRAAHELSALTASHPGCERLAELEMLALYLGGRTADALAAFGRTTSFLRDELGLDPGEPLRRLHERILADDPSLRCPPAAAPPGTPDLSHRPRELPAITSHFTGRERELAELTSAVAAHDDRETPVVAITGMGGVGKSAIAVHWAHLHAGEYPDGQIFMTLHGYDGRPPVTQLDALRQMLRRFEVPASAMPANAADAAAAYRSLLAERRVLIVLDDARSAQQVRPLVPGSPGCAVIVTSRDRLTGLVARDGARRVEVDVLPQADAIGLLQRIVGPAADHPAASELADVCGRLPLALRLAAARYADLPGRSIEDYVVTLRSGNQLAALDAGGDLGSSMLAVFDSSFDSLDPSEQRLFCLLGLLDAPDVASWVAGPLLGVDHEQGLARLQALVEAQLVQLAGADECGQTRYRLHDLLRAYARRRADQSGAATAIGRALSGWLALACAADRRCAGRIVPHRCGTAPRWELPVELENRLLRDPFRWFSSERDALLAGVRTAAAGGLDEHAWELADSLAAYGELRDTALLLEATETALAASRAAGDQRGEAVMLRNLAMHDTFSNRYEYDSSVKTAEAAAAVFESIRDGSGRADALYLRGLILSLSGRAEESLASHRRSIDLARESEYRTGEVNGYLGVASTLRRQSRFDEAAAQILQGLALARQTGLLRQLHGLTTELGIVRKNQGRLAESLEHLTESLRLVRRLDSPAEETYTLINLAETQRLSGSPEARVTYRRCLAFTAEHSWPYVEAMALRGLGELDVATGQCRRAVERLVQALHRATPLGLPLLTGRVRRSLAAAYVAGGDLDAARRELVSARTDFVWAENAVDLAAVDRELQDLAGRRQR